MPILFGREYYVKLLSQTNPYFGGFGLQFEDAKLLAELFFLTSSSPLKKLTLFANNIGDEGIIAMCESLLHPLCKVQLTSLDIGNNAITEKGAYYIAKVLSTPFCSLSSLVLTGNKLGENGGNSLAAALSMNTSLYELYLGYCDISNKGLLNLLLSTLLHSTSKCLISFNSFEPNCGLQRDIVQQSYFNNSVNRISKIIDDNFNQFISSHSTILFSSICDHNCDIMTIQNGDRLHNNNNNIVVDDLKLLAISKYLREDQIDLIVELLKNMFPEFPNYHLPSFPVSIFDIPKDHLIWRISFLRIIQFSLSTKSPL